MCVTAASLYGSGRVHSRCKETIVREIHGLLFMKTRLLHSSASHTTEVIIVLFAEPAVQISQDTFRNGRVQRVCDRSSRMCHTIIR